VLPKRHCSMCTCGSARTVVLLFHLGMSALTSDVHIDSHSNPSVLLETKEFIIKTAPDRDQEEVLLTVRASKLDRNLTDLRTYFSERLAVLGEDWFKLVEADKELRSSVDFFMGCFDDFDQLYPEMKRKWIKKCNDRKRFASEVISELAPAAEDLLQCQGRHGVLHCPMSGFYVRFKDETSSGALGALLHTDGGDGYYDPWAWPDIKGYYHNQDSPGGEWVNSWVQLYGEAGRQMLFIDPSSCKQRSLPEGPRLTPYPGREGNLTDWKFLYRPDLRPGVGYVWNTTLVPHVNALPAHSEARLLPTLTVDVRCTCAIPEISEFVEHDYSKIDL